MRMLVPAAAAALLGLAGCDSGPAPSAGPSAAATIRLPAIPGRPGAGYFELRVPPGRGALVAVTTPQAGRVEMHESPTSGNAVTMRRLDRVPAVEGRIAFTPGGRHLMLFDVDPALRPGGAAELTFHFEQGAPLTLEAELVPPGGGGGGGRR